RRDRAARARRARAARPRRAHAARARRDRAARPRRDRASGLQRLRRVGPPHPAAPLAAAHARRADEPPRPRPLRPHRAVPRRAGLMDRDRSSAWVLNFDADEELARPAGYSPRRAVVDRAPELAVRVAALLRPGDVVLSPELSA